MVIDTAERWSGRPEVVTNLDAPDRDDPLSLVGHDFDVGPVVDRTIDGQIISDLRPVRERDVGVFRTICGHEIERAIVIHVPVRDGYQRLVLLKSFLIPESGRIPGASVEEPDLYVGVLARSERPGDATDRIGAVLLLDQVPRMDGVNEVEPIPNRERIRRSCGAEYILRKRLGMVFAQWRSGGRAPPYSLLREGDSMRIPLKSLERKVRHGVPMLIPESNSLASSFYSVKTAD